MLENAVTGLTAGVNDLRSNVSGIKGDLADVKSTSAQMLEILIELQGRIS